MHNFLLVSNSVIEKWDRIDELSEPGDVPKFSDLKYAKGIVRTAGKSEPESPHVLATSLIEGRGD